MLTLSAWEFDTRSGAREALDAQLIWTGLSGQQKAGLREAFELQA
jgi:hypothetical protein